MPIVYNKQSPTYSKQTFTKHPKTWTENVINRNIIWTYNGTNKLVYRVVGERTNHDGQIIKPEYKDIELMQSFRTMYEINDEILIRLAELWKASVCLKDLETIHISDKIGDKWILNRKNPPDTYPYFYNEE